MQCGDDNKYNNLGNIQDTEYGIVQKYCINQFQRKKVAGAVQLVCVRGLQFSSMVLGVLELQDPAFCFVFYACIHFKELF